MQAHHGSPVKPRNINLGYSVPQNIYLLQCQHHEHDANACTCIIKQPVLYPTSAPSILFHSGGLNIRNMVGIGHTVPYIRYSFNPWRRKQCRPEGGYQGCSFEAYAFLTPGVLTARERPLYCKLFLLTYTTTFEKSWLRPGFARQDMLVLCPGGGEITRFR